MSLTTPKTLRFAKPIREEQIVEISYGGKLVRKDRMGRRPRFKTHTKKVGDVRVDIFDEDLVVNAYGDDESEWQVTDVRTGGDDEDGDDEDLDAAEVDYSGEEEIDTKSLASAKDDEEDEEAEGQKEDEGRVKAEKSEIYVEKMVPRYRGPIQELAKRMLPTEMLKVSRFVKVTTTDRIFDYVTIYEGSAKKIRTTQKGKVGASGEPIVVMFPYIGPRTGLRRVGEQIPRSIAPFRIDEDKPRLAFQADNPFNPEFSLGTRVSVEVNGKKVTGVVINFDSKGVKISPNENSIRALARLSASDNFWVGYEEPTLVKLEKLVRQKLEFSRPPKSISELYPLPVPDKLRKLVISRYRDTLSTLKGDESSSETGKKPKVIPPPLVSEDDYLQSEFSKWFFLEKKSEIESAIDVADIDRQARQQVADMLNIPLQLELIATSVKEGMESMSLKELSPPSSPPFVGSGSSESQGFNVPFSGLSKDLFSLTRREIVDALRKKKNPTILDVKVLLGLERNTTELTGRDLAVELSIIMEDYYRTFPPDLAKVYQNLFTATVFDRYREIEPTDDDREKFMGAYGKQLSDTYKTYAKEYHEKYPVTEPTPPPKLVPTVSLEGIERFEQLTLASAGSSIESYLKAVLLPYLFLGGNFSPAAKFFKAKVALGYFPTSSFCSLNLAHFIPEVTTNPKLTDLDWHDISIIIEENLEDLMGSFLDAYLSMLYPATKSIFSERRDLEDLNRWVIELCPLARRAILENNRYVYPKGPREPHRRLMEKIPVEDLIICYDGVNFSCHSIRDLMIRLSAGDNINPVTGKQFPAKFIADLQARFSGEIVPQEPLDVPQKETPKISKEVTPLVIPKALPTRVRPPKAGTKKKPIQSITKMALLSPGFQLLTLFNSSLAWEVLIQGNIQEREIAIGRDPTEKDVNVVAVIFDMSNPATLFDMADELKKLSQKKRLYVFGIKNPTITGSQLLVLKARVTRSINPAGYYYLEGDSEPEMKDALGDILVDMEGLDVIQSISPRFESSTAKKSDVKPSSSSGKVVKKVSVKAVSKPTGKSIKKSAKK